MYSKVFKRLFDIIFSIIGLILFIPVFIVVAPLIWLDDRGPIFYNANRLGKNGKIFKMFKFRTMKVNSPDIRNKDGSTYNSDDDPRLTRIGKLLRKASIDELPQIINVFIGQMSFIGPRPLVLSNGVDYNHLNKDKKKRSEVRPGISGYSQAYFRNSISEKEKIKYDIYYVKNISFILDVKIFFKTIISVIKKENINSK